MQAARLSWLAWTGLGALLILHAVLALHAVSGKSITGDEIFHLTGGYLRNQYGDHRVHPDNGPLPQRWQALPAYRAGAHPPALTGNDAWRLSDLYTLCHQFLYESGNDHWPLLMGARRMNLLWSLGAAAMVFWWARKLAGNLAGFTALVLLVLSPTVLAHAPLATSDMSAACLLACSTGMFWWQLHDARRGPMLASAMVFGLACVSKFSIVLLVPVLLLLFAIHWIRAPRAERNGPRAAASLLVHGATAYTVIWTLFGFRYSMFSPELPSGASTALQQWNVMLARLGWQADVVDFARRWHLLPEGYLLGFTNTLVMTQARAAFLAGEYSDGGWVRFFPLAFLWKSTGAELLGTVLALVAAGWHWRRLRPWLYALTPLLAWSAVYGAAALFSHLNIGHRHLLPLYPGLFIVAGVAAARLTSSAHWRYGIAAGLMILQVLAAARIHPHYLAYFNAPAGGPANGYRLLVDSSLDWGQDLPALRAWLAANNPPGNPSPVYLSYFGSGDPSYYQLEATRLPFVNGFKFLHPYYTMSGGIYCISATMLQGVYSPVRGDFTAVHEREYQSLRAFSADFRAYWTDPDHSRKLDPAAEAAIKRAWLRFDLLRFSRLCHYLRARSPDATAGCSILIYRLTDEEVDRALFRSYSDWADAIAKTADAPR